MAKIIIVDDDKHFRKVYSQILSQHGHQISEAYDGSDGVEVMISTPIDIAIIDILMPVRNGFEIIEDIKKIFPKIKIIAVSGAATDDDLNKAKRIGADYILPKPFEAEKLITAISEILDQ